jgi:phenylacetate-CoA ligase
VAVYDRPLYQASPVFVQNAAITACGFVTCLLRRGRLFRRILSELERSQWISAEEFAALQNERLAALITHCYEKVPYYRDVMRERGLTPADITTVEDLPKLPLLTKEIVRTQGDRLLREDLGRRGVYRSKTSGTTGTPLKLVRDHYSVNAEQAFIWRLWRAAGMDLGDRRATMRGDFIVAPEERRPPFWRHNGAERQLFLSMLHLSLHSAPEYFAALRRFRPKALETFPTGGLHLAKLALELGEELDLDYVLTASEPVDPDMRETIQEAFSCKVVDYYGLAERVVFAMECPEHHNLHLAPEYGATEFVEPEECSPEGALEIVGTSFINYAMPLVRYRTGDLSNPAGSDCPCGRAMPLMEPVETRVGGNVVLADGRCIRYLALTRVLGNMRHIRKSQIIQNALDHFLVRIVPGADFTDDDARALKEGMLSLLAADVSIDVELVDEIPREKSGKLRLFIPLPESPP